MRSLFCYTVDTVKQHEGNTVDNGVKYAEQAGTYGALVDMLCNDVERLLTADNDAQRTYAEGSLKLLVKQAREAQEKFSKEVDTAQA